MGLSTRVDWDLRIVMGEVYRLRDCRGPQYSERVRSCFVYSGDMAKETYTKIPIYIHRSVFVQGTTRQTLNLKLSSQTKWRPASHRPDSWGGLSK